MKSIYRESVNETLFYTKHESGLDVYAIPKIGYSQVFGVFAVRYGSNDSEFIPPGADRSIVVPDGIAHFLEHKMFEQEKGSIFDDYAALGSSPNAYTNFTTTAYLFTSTGNIKENTELLLNSIQNPYFTDESIEKEKGIIEQEIKMYEDNPSWRVYFNLLDCMYVRYPVKKEIAGTVESISQINREMLYDCYKTFYHPSNTMFLIVGDVDPKEISSIVDDNLSKQRYEHKNIPKRVYPHEPPTLNKISVEQKLGVAQPIFAIGFKDTDIGYQGRDLLKKEIITSIILEQLFGRSSQLYRNLYDKGLINNSFGSDYVGEKDYGYSMVNGESKDPEKIYSVIREYIMDKGMDAIEEKSFQRIKKKFTGQFLGSFNSVEYIGSNFVSYYTRDINLLDYIDVISEIEYKDITDRFKRHISTDFMAISIISPI